MQSLENEIMFMLGLLSGLLSRASNVIINYKQWMQCDACDVTIFRVNACTNSRQFLITAGQFPISNSCDWNFVYIKNELSKYSNLHCRTVGCVISWNKITEDANWIYYYYDQGCLCCLMAKQTEQQQKNRLNGSWANRHFRCCYCCCCC